MGVRVRYSDGSERWCESCADPNDNGGSVVNGGTEHNTGGGSQFTGDTGAEAASQGPGGNGVAGTQAAAATAKDRIAYPTFYKQSNNTDTGGGPAGGAPYAPPQNGLSNAFNPAHPAVAQTPSTGSQMNYGAQGTMNAQTHNQKTDQEWAFDPTQPTRAVSAGMSLLGLPTYGPAADFYARYGLPDIGMSLASGDFATPGAFQNSMTQRLSGENNGMDVGSMIRSLMGGETLAHDQNQKGYTGTSSPTDTARAAFIAQMENDPAALAQMFSGVLTGGTNGMSTSVAGLLGNYTGNIAQRRFNSDVPQNDTLNYIGKLLGY